MKKQRTYYDRSFKENAVKLSHQRTNQSALARELGVDPALLRRWRILDLVSNSAYKVKPFFYIYSFFLQIL
jgi:transposase